jgi:hypothetical protein
MEQSEFMDPKPQLSKAALESCRIYWRAQQYSASKILRHAYERESAIIDQLAADAIMTRHAHLLTPPLQSPERD